MMCPSRREAPRQQTVTRARYDRDDRDKYHGGGDCHRRRKKSFLGELLDF
jgi:Zn-finger nucleic acid-binding protein